MELGGCDGSIRAPIPARRDWGSDCECLMSEVLRILDVNLNRARESLRGIEDYARFVLDDRDAAAGAKFMRHEMREIVDSLGAGALLEQRDIGGDVGRNVKTESEETRRDADEVLAAAFARF